jgi:glycosyl hydrolase family 42 (putative beta-galactosidase)
MKQKISAAVLLSLFAVALFAGVQSGSAKPPAGGPMGFFGMGPQEGITPTDGRYMKAGGVESIRIAVPWGAIQPTKRGGYDWSGLDNAVETTTNAGLQVLPFFYQTPRWLAGNWRTLPVNNGRQRAAWTAFLKAAVKRYGPGGEFWAERAPGVVQYAPAISNPLPIRTWQIWNEANFFYFAYPVSPQRYAKLAMISGAAIKSVDPGAQVLLTGLFGEPTAKGSRGMDATDFLRGVYRTPGIKSRFDGVALHPYAANSEDLEEMVEGIHEVTTENHDRPSFYITEMGWGSQNNYKQVAFEQGIRGQVRELRAAYGYLLDNRRRLNLKGVYWFSWKDLAGSCNFCDSVGLFRAGSRYRPKPAWHAFVAITGGRARP